MKTPIYADLDQIVFEGRSTSYGAYQMRKQYDRILSRAALIAFLMFIAATALPKMVSWIMPDVDDIIVEAEAPLIGTEVILADPIDEPEPEPIPTIPEPPAPRVDVRTIAFLNPVPTPEDSVFTDVLLANNSDLDSALVGLVDIDGDTPGDYDWNKITGPAGPGGSGETEVKDKPDIDDHTTFVNLEKEPKPVNMDELSRLIGYPPLAKQGEIQGKVVLRVKVDANGNYVKHVVLRSDHGILLSAVAQNISNLICTPGIQAGKPIPVWLTIPFNFVLNQ